MPQLFRLLLLFSALLSGLSLRAQDAWSAFNQELTRADLWSIAYGDNTLVAVGKSGTILSYNYADQAWLPRDSGVDAWLVGVGHGNSRFIAVGDQGIILTSDDAGETWTPRVSGTTIRINAVAYGGGRWLAVGEQGVVLTSIDGNTWEARPALGTGFLRGLAYGQERFFIGGSGGRIYTTPDATTFTRLSISIRGSFLSEDIEAIACSHERIFFAGSSGLAVSTPDLAVWNQLSAAPQGTFRGIALRNPREASAVGDRIAYNFLASPSGDSWSSARTALAFLATAVVQGKDEMVCVGLGGRIARSSLASPVLVAVEGNRSLPYGGTTRLTAFTNGTPTAYQWLRNGTPLSGATNPELILSNVTTAHAGDYTVRASFGGTSTSSTVTRISVFSNTRPDSIDPSFTYPFDDVPSVAHALPDGKLLVCRRVQLTPSDLGTLQINRLNSDGSVDPTFQLTSATVFTGEITRMQTLSDGRIYLFGRFSVGGSALVAAARIFPNGTLDPAFDHLQFTTSPQVEYIAAASDGAVYYEDRLGAGQRRNSQIFRHTSEGRRDPAFPTLTGQLMGVDSRGRLLVATTLLRRHLPDGALDPSYTSSEISYLPLTSSFVHYQLTDNGLYVLGANYGRVGASYYFARYLPDGGVDRSYGVVPTPTYGLIGEILKYTYRPDGGLWTTRGIEAWYNSGTRSQSLHAYTPEGKADRTRYIQAPADVDFEIRAVGADGAVYAYLGDFTFPRRFVRLQSHTGTPGRLTNLSVRSHVPSAEAPLIAGFVTAGSGPARALLRAIGPGLAEFGVTDTMQDPQLTLRWNGGLVATNDDWDAALAPLFSTLGAFPLAVGSRDAALDYPILAGNYTSVITPANAPGTALAEIYEIATGTPSRRIVNLSARSEVTPQRALILGFTVGGAIPVTALIRAVGPSLASFGVSDTLADPQLTLYRGATAVWENDDGADTFVSSAQAVGAFALQSGSKDSVMQVLLTPGSYTAVVSGGTGNALVEVYEVP